MTKKRKTGLAIGAAAACITVLCAAGACNSEMGEEPVHQAITTTTASASQTTESHITTTPPTTTAPVTMATDTTTAPRSQQL